MYMVLIITDNIGLCRWFRSVFDANQHSSGIAEFDYRYSSINKIPDKFIEDGVEDIDLGSDIEVSRLIKTYDLIFSLHSKKIFPTKLVKGVKCINVHPGLNPYNRGWYPQVFSIINKLPAGATIHEMDEDIDHGPVICQEEVDIKVTDDSFDVYQKVIATEKKLLTQWLPDIITGSYGILEPSGDSNYNSIDDFKEICKLDLDSVGTLRKHIDLLRSLSHSDFKNAYFYTENGKKIYVKIMLDSEE